MTIEDIMKRAKIEYAEWIKIPEDDPQWIGISFENYLIKRLIEMEEAIDYKD